MYYGTHIKLQFDIFYGEPKLWKTELKHWKIKNYERQKSSVKTKNSPEKKLQTNFETEKKVLDWKTDKVNWTCSFSK